MNDELTTKLTFTREQRRAIQEALSMAKVALEYAAKNKPLPEAVAREWLEKVTASRDDLNKAEWQMEFVGHAATDKPRVIHRNGQTFAESGYNNFC